jgi:hypothetical protein
MSEFSVRPNAFTADGGPHKANRIRDVADGLRRVGEFESAEMLNSYADLREQIELARDGVTDEVALRLCVAYYGDPAWKFMSHKSGCVENMRAALLSVAHLLPNKPAQAAKVAEPVAQPCAVPDDWHKTFAELLEDYAGSRAEVALWNVTQRMQPDGSIRFPKPRLARLMAHVDLLAPQPAESNGENGK